MTPPVSTTNACRMCMPLGAVLAFAGIEKAVPLLHGGQGCATYIRRYLISHFNEPVDVASSSFAEEDTVFGGENTLHQGIRNLVLGYDPGLVGVATTCLAETIGEDVPAMLGRLRDGEDAAALPPMVDVATPSYAGTHADGFRAAVAAVVERLACPTEACAGGRRHPGGEADGRVLLLPGILSSADLRHLREFCDLAGVPVTLLPDYGDSLDGPATDVYPVLRPGGTPLESVVRAGAAPAAITLGGLAVPGTASAGEILAARFGTPHHQLPFPIGIRLTDRFAEVLRGLAGTRTDAAPAGAAVGAAGGAERGRLVDAYVDGHKYVAGKRAVVFGDEDLVVGLTSFLTEIGVHVVVAASGGRSGCLEATLRHEIPGLRQDVVVLQDADFDLIDRASAQAEPDLLVGHSKGYPTSRALGVPLVRVGLPVHDRVGGQRVLHVGYRGAQHLFDRIVNTLIGQAQDASPVGYAYM